MKQHTFRSYEKYAFRQRDHTLNKIEKKKFSPFARQSFIDTLPDRWVNFGLCHGVRFGDEVDYFQTKYGGQWIGTEITKDVCDERKIYCHDFNQPREGWTGKFDIIYSNALDHAFDPQQTLAVWFDQLAGLGWLLVEWTVWSEKLGARGNKADCFAASLGEYVDLLESQGIVEGIVSDHEDLKNRRKMLICCRG